jgi:prolyl-tRNA synthetase
MLDVYTRFAEEYLAMPVLRGVKSPSERFAGALDTYAIEALMQDGKALQAGTSHFLGQNFAKAFNCTFTNKNNEQEHVWATSWGVSTRLIGGLIMTHSDDKGLVLPPRLAPIQVVIVPIYRKDAEKDAVLDAIYSIRDRLNAVGVRVHVDAREEQRPGWKFAEYEAKGVPVRLAVGPRDVQNGTVELARRDRDGKESLPMDSLADIIPDLLESVQADLFQAALDRREAGTHVVDDYDAFKAALDRGGFVLAHWDGTEETEAQIKEETKATIRVIPLDHPLAGGDGGEAGTDPVSGKPSQGRVVYARAY